MQLTKYTFIDLGSSVIEYEVYENILILHCSVTKWTPTTYKKLLSAFNTLKQEAKEQGYDKLATFTPNPKFAKMFGGETVDHLVVNNQYVEVIIWELKQS